tara:strand:- start:37178 stop:38626 length:1449 start_codon:yes stop_codon:yes gene_type:complete
MILVAFSFLVVGSSLFAGLIPVGAGNYAEQRFLLCLVVWLAVCLCLGKYVAYRDHAAKIGWLPWLLPLIIVFLSGEFYAAAYDVEPLMFAFFFLGCCLCADHLSQSGSLSLQLGRILTVIALLALIYGFIALMNYGLALRDGNTEVDTTVTWGFPNIRYWSHLATWLIPLIAAAQRFGSLSTLPVVRGLSVLAGSLWWWMLFSTSARGSALGLLVGCLVVAVFFKRHTLDWLRSFGIQLLGGGTLWLLLTLILPWLFFGAADLREIDADSAGRMPLWREAWEMSLVNFPFGMGPQSWLTHSIISDEYANSKSYGHPHNMYLLWAAEYGWISLAALAIAVAGIMKSLLVRSSAYVEKGRDATVMAGFTASVVAAGVHSGFSAVLMAPASMLTGFLVLTLFLAMLQAPLQGDSQRLSVPARRLVRLSAGFALLAVLAVGPLWIQEVWRYYQDNLEDRLTYKGQGSIYSPRFWSHGDFPRQRSAD